MRQPFSITRRVAFADTDAMRVTHHANYLHFCEEARVSWMRERQLTATHFPHDERVLAVLGYSVRHLSSSTFDDLLVVQLQTRREGARIRFQYRVLRDDIRIAEVETSHIMVDGSLRPTKPGARFLEILGDEPWSDDFLASLGR